VAGESIKGAGSRKREGGCTVKAIVMIEKCPETARS